MRSKAPIIDWDRKLGRGKTLKGKEFPVMATGIENPWVVVVNNGALKLMKKSSFQELP